ncbi:MAG: presqualene diphosphate synthase HpnD [Propylenella sp.]
MAAVAHEAAATSPGRPTPALPAAGSSFYTAMRILPAEEREAMYAIYAFCRAVDDIADDEGPREPRRAALDAWRDDIDLLFKGTVRPATADLAQPTRRFRLRREDFHAVIDGMAMDLEADLFAPDWDTLDVYCDRVASAVGRLSVRIFGLEPEPGDALAHHLGRALQLTNILRDLDEDAERGRLYLPREALVRAGIAIDGRSAGDILSRPAIGVVCEEIAARAADHFAHANRIMAQVPRRAVRAPRLMEAAYRQILARLRARGWMPPRAPVKVSKLRLLGAVVRHGVW